MRACLNISVFSMLFVLLKDTAPLLFLDFFFFLTAPLLFRFWLFRPVLSSVCVCETETVKD